MPPFFTVMVALPANEKGWCDPAIVFHTHVIPSTRAQSLTE